jgi:hypothetical protein
MRGSRGGAFDATDYSARFISLRHYFFNSLLAPLRFISGK